MDNTAYPQPGDGIFTISGTVQSVFAAYVGSFGLTGQTQAGLSGSWSNALPEHVAGQNYRIGLPLAGLAKGFARLFFEDP